MSIGESIVKNPSEIKVVNAPDVSVNTEIVGDALKIFLKADQTPVSEVVLVWKGLSEGAGLVLGDHWERGYGDLEWKPAKDAGVMPWYFLDDRKSAVLGFGVKVRPSALCYWEVSDGDVLLHLDVRCGGEGVILGGRKLNVAEVVIRSYENIG